MDAPSALSASVPGAAAPSAPGALHTETIIGMLGGPPRTTHAPQWRLPPPPVGQRPALAQGGGAPLAHQPPFVRAAYTVPVEVLRAAQTIDSRLGLDGVTRLYTYLQFGTATRLEELSMIPPEPRWSLFATAEFLRGRSASLARCIRGRVAFLQTLEQMVAPLASLLEAAIPQEEPAERSTGPAINDLDRIRANLPHNDLQIMLQELLQGDVWRLSDEVRQIEDLSEALQEAIPVLRPLAQLFPAEVSWLQNPGQPRGAWGPPSTTATTATPSLQPETTPSSVLPDAALPSDLRSA